MSNKPDDKDDKLTMTFTRHEWRVIAVACHVVEKMKYAKPSDASLARLLAGVIAKKTRVDE